MNYTTCEKARLKAGHHRSSVSHERSHVLLDSISGQSTWSSLMTTSGEIPHDQSFDFLASGSKSYAPQFNMGHYFCASISLRHSRHLLVDCVFILIKKPTILHVKCRHLKHTSI